MRKGSCALSAACFVALGICLVSQPELSMVWICRLLGAALLLCGAVYAAFHFIRAKAAALVLQYDLILGIILALVGLWVLTSPVGAASLLQYILGAVLLIHGAIDLQGAWSLRRIGVRRWWAALLLGVVTAALGILILCQPFAAAQAMLMLVGCSLIYDGVSDLVLIALLYFMQKREARRIEEEAKDAVEGEGEVVK